jgi:hypothetical protein
MNQQDARLFSQPNCFFIVGTYWMHCSLIVALVKLKLGHHSEGSSTAVVDVLENICPTSTCQTFLKRKKIERQRAKLFQEFMILKTTCQTFSEI